MKPTPKETAKRKEADRERIIQLLLDMPATEHRNEALQAIAR